MRPQRPLTILNRPTTAVLPKILSPQANPAVTLKRAYRFLVTQQGIDPIIAKKVLGLPE